MADQLHLKIAKQAASMDTVETDVPAFKGFPAAHRAKLHSTNPLERSAARVQPEYELRPLADEEAGPVATNELWSGLSNVIIYTSLESSAQCTGAITLVNVNSAVYLQTELGQYRIGNLLYQSDAAFGRG